MPPHPFVDKRIAIGGSERRTTPNHLCTDIWVRKAIQLMREETVWVANGLDLGKDMDVGGIRYHNLMSHK